MRQKPDMKRVSQNKDISNLRVRTSGMETLYLHPKEQAGLHARCRLKWCEVKGNLMTPQSVVRSRRVEFQEDFYSSSSVDMCLQVDGRTGRQTAVLVRALEGWKSGHMYT
jgi:hypothetical protein